MEDSNSAVLKRLQELKTQARSHDIKLKLNLFIKAKKLGNASEACSRMGMGRTFYYKWWKRLKESDYKIESLNELSRKPKRSPNQTSKELEDKIIDLKVLSHGALMIHGVLLRENIKISVQTISHILNERKEVTRKERKRLNPHNKRYELLKKENSVKFKETGRRFPRNNHKRWPFWANIVFLEGAPMVPRCKI